MVAFHEVFALCLAASVWTGATGGAPAASDGQPTPPGAGEQRTKETPPGRQDGAAKPAGYLVLDTQEVTLKYTRPVWGGDEQGPQFVLTLRDRDGSGGISKLRVRPDGPVSGPGGTVSLPDHLSFALDGHEAALWSYPEVNESTAGGAQPPPQAAIPAGGQSLLRAKLQDLPPGEYKFALRFDSPDSRSGPEQRLTVTASVRHHFFWPLLVLVLGVLVAWITAKGIANWRASLQIEQTIAGLDRVWLRELPSLPAIVWLRAMLRQSTDLIRLGWRVLVPAPEAITTRLRRATALFQVLYEYQRARRAVAHSEQSTMAIYQLERRLDEIVRDLDDPEAIDDATVQTKRAEVGKVLESMSSYDRADASVARRASRLLASVHAGQFSDCTPDEQKKIAALLKTIGAGAAPTGATFQRVRAVMKILVDRRDDVLAKRDNVNFDQLHDLVRALPADGALNDTDLKDLFRTFDRQNWRRLEHAQQHIRVTPAERGAPPAAKPVTPIEAYQPFSLQIEVEDDADLSSEFMLRSRMDCTWHFVLKPTPGGWLHPVRWLRQRFGFGNGQRQWSARSRGNRIVQFAPFAGTLQIKVDMGFDGSKPLAAPEHFLTIARATEFSRMRAFQKTDLVATALTTVLAVVTGLASQYVANAAFGSFKDYLTLFLWGAGLDTGKNMLQMLAGTAGTAAAPAQPATGVSPAAPSTQPDDAKPVTPIAQTAGAAGSAPVSKPKGVRSSG